MQKRKLNYHFHDPNQADVAADYILKVFMEVNEAKVEKALKAAMARHNDEKESSA